MKKMISVWVIFSLALSAMAYGNNDATEQKLNTENLLRSYFLSWVTKDEQQRLVILNKLWVKNGLHQSPFSHSKGIDAINQEISGFLQSNPDVTLKYENIKQTGNNVLCQFVVKKADGTVWLTGADYFEFNDDNKLVKVTGFI